jgi:hypothetical protein
MYSQEEKDKMAMKNSTIDKFAAKQGCPEGYAPDANGVCQKTAALLKKEKELQLKTGMTPIPGSNLYQKPKSKAERKKNMEDAKRLK